MQQRRGLLMQVIMHVQIGIGPYLPETVAHIGWRWRSDGGRCTGYLDTSSDESAA